MLSTHREVSAIQYLRGGAALMVVLFHASREVRGRLGMETFAWGEFGVDVFFVISGFVMVYSTAEKRHLTSREFLKRRLLRIAPMYWIMTLLLAAVLAIRPSVFKSAVLDFSHLAKSLLFIPHFHPGIPGAVMPMLVPGWTLTYEMYFYGLFAAGMTLSLHKRVATVTLGLAASTAFFAAPSCQSAVCRFLGDQIALEFALGMGVALLYLRGWLLPHVIAPIVAGTALLVVVLAASTSARLTTAGVTSAVLVYACLACRMGVSPKLRKFLLILGDSSFSLYLTHVFVIGATGLAWRTLLRSQPSDSVMMSLAFMMLCVAGSVVLGAVAYRLIEDPVTDMVRRRVQDNRIPRSVEGNVENVLSEGKNGSY